MEMMVVSIRPGMLDIIVVAKEVTASEAAPTPFSAMERGAVLRASANPSGRVSSQFERLLPKLFINSSKTGMLVFIQSTSP